MYNLNCIYSAQLFPGKSYFHYNYLNYCVILSKRGKCPQDTSISKKEVN